MTMYVFVQHRNIMCLDVVLVDRYYNLKLENGGVENGISESKCGNVVDHV